MIPADINIYRSIHPPECLGHTYFVTIRTARSHSVASREIGSRALAELNALRSKKTPLLSCTTLETLGTDISILLKEQPISAALLDRELNAVKIAGFEVWRNSELSQQCHAWRSLLANLAEFHSGIPLALKSGPQRGRFVMLCLAYHAFFSRHLAYPMESARRAS